MRELRFIKHSVDTFHSCQFARLIEDEGLKGYGIYWATMEYLFGQPGYQSPLENLGLLARRIGIRKTLLLRIIQSYKLFLVDDTHFSAPHLAETLKRTTRNPSGNENKPGDGDKPKDGDNPNGGGNPEGGDNPDGGDNPSNPAPGENPGDENPAPPPPDENPGDEKQPPSHPVEKKPENTETPMPGATADAPSGESEKENNPPAIGAQFAVETSQSATIKSQSACNTTIKRSFLPCNPLKMNTPSDRVEKDVDIDVEKEKEIYSHTNSCAREETALQREEETALQQMRQFVRQLPGQHHWLREITAKIPQGKWIKTNFLRLLPEFESYLCLMGEEESIQSMADARRRFFCWLGRKSGKETIRRLQQGNPDEPYLYRHEERTGGKRTYFGLPIPDHAPPRPDEMSFWDEGSGQWRK